MKKILFLLLLTASANSQALFDKGIKITGGIATENTAAKVVVQSANNVLNTISKSDLVDVLSFASAVNLPVTGLSGKIYITNDDNKIYLWNGTIYQPLSITGTGTTNFLPKFTGASALGNSLIFDNGTNIGIGLSTPSSLLHLNSSLSTFIRLQTTNGAGKVWGIGVDNAYNNGINFSEVGVADGRLFLQAGGNVGIGTFTPNAKLDVNGTFNATGVAKFSSSVTANSLEITTAPLTSSGTPPILTYNAATKAIESVPYNNVAASANSILLTGNQSATGRKTFNSDNTTVGGINLINSRTTNTGGTADSNGILVINSGSSGILVEANANSGIVAKSINAGTTGILVESFSSGTGLSLRNQGGTGDLLNAEVGVTRITSNGAFISNDITANGLLKLKSYTVATLPTGVQGAIAYVTDATAPTYLGTLTGGGSVKVPVFFNGTAWVSH